MRTARLLPCMVLTAVAASTVSATSWPDPAINPFQTLPSPYPAEFQDYSQLFARILADRGLGWNQPGAFENRRFSVLRAA